MMAKRNCMYYMCIPLCFAFSAWICHALGLNDFPAKDAVTVWAENLGNQLASALNTYSGIQNLENKYDNLQKARLTSIDGGHLVHRMSADLTKSLQKKVEALERLVEAAEGAVISYKYLSDITKEEVEFVNVKSFTDDDSRLIYSEKFRKKVNFSYSGVHVPLEIYEGYPEILNGLKWSAVLDKVFHENLQRDSELQWQHFGSQAGFMRTYPASKWIDIPKIPDLFDVRLRPWYVHGSSSPKDMLILLDTSGSMHGQTMEIMKIAAKTLLTTLGENDYVNVAWFSNEADWVTCLDTFVQANRRNKQLLSKGIDDLKDGNMASLSHGLEFAFKQFLSFQKNKTSWAGADCNEVIMLFSDGGTEEAWDVLEKYNANKSIRIFTYAVGPHPIPYATLKQSACANRGYFTPIPAMGAIRTKVQDYMKVLGRPLVLSGDRHFQLTNFYMDAMGLGMMTTVTLPVFNRTEEGNNQTLLGVVGIDITLQEMTDKEPSYEIGPTGYSFAINHNGFAVFHPSLNTKFDYLDDPPHEDFLDVEVENPAKEELRRLMIDQETGNRSIISLIKMPDGKHVVRHKMDYFFTLLHNTTFSIGLVIPSGRSHYLAVDGMNTSEGIDIRNEEIDGTFLAPWKYCHNTVLNGNMSEIIKNISSTLIYNHTLCKHSLVQRLLWDVKKTVDVYHFWQTEDIEGKREPVIASFVQTESGLTRVYPPRESSLVVEETNPSNSSFFKRAVFGDDYIFVPPAGLSNQSRESGTTVVKAVSITRRGTTYKPAVVGVHMDVLWLHPYLISTAISPGKMSVSCSDLDQVICYLIDDGGFVISSNQVNYWTLLGKFLGEVDSEIMQKLYEDEIFRRVEKTNYESYCPVAKKVSAGFRTVHSPIFSLLHIFNLSWLADAGAWLEVKLWIYSLFSWLWPETSALPEFLTELGDVRVCTTHEAQYYLKKWDGTIEGEYVCNNCTRFYSLAKVSKTNLLLLVASHPCSPLLCEAPPPLLQAPIEVLTDTSHDECDQANRYRRRQDICYDFNPRENNTECGAVSSLALPHLALFVELICLIFLKEFGEPFSHIP